MITNAFPLWAFIPKTAKPGEDAGKLIEGARLWARGALTVLPQPQLQGASGTVLAARFELLVSHSLSWFLRRFYTFWAFQDAPPCTRYVFYIGIKNFFLVLIPT